MAIGDLNGDGRSDAAVANAFGGVSVLAGDGDGTFQPATNVDTNGGAGPVGIGDFDNDSHADLAVVVSDPSSSYLSIYRGNGDGTFQAAQTANLNPRSRAMAISDLNGDGDPDVVVSSFGGEGLLVLRGNGDGTFAAPVSYSSEGQPWSIALGDFNGDGKSDLAIAIFAESNSVGVMLGNGDGTFQGLRRYPSGNGSLFLATSDLNRDGRPDLAVVNYNAGNVSVLIGIGDGSFEPPVTYAVDGASGTLAIGDLNGDGSADLAVTNSGSSTVSVLLGVGNGTFEAASNYAAGSVPTAIVISDLDGDGRPDLAIAASGDGLVTLFGHGDGSFETADFYDAGAVAGFRTLATGDLNNDGHPDLVVASEVSAEVSVLLGRVDGTFDTAIDYFGASAPRSVAVGDINNDGHDDVVAVSVDTGAPGGAAGVTVFLGNGDGTLNHTPNFLAGRDLRSVAIGDLDHDGNADLVLADATGGHGNSGQVFVLTGNGDGTFRPASGYPTAGDPSSVSIGDLDHDGRLDVAATNANTDVASIFLGNGDGTLATAVGYAAGDGDRSAAIGDVNSDGNADLVAVGGGANGRVSVLLGEGNGAFKAPTAFPSGYDGYSVAIGDLNGDQTPDVAVANYGFGAGASHISVLVGNGDGSFMAATDYTTAGGTHSVAIADLNGDGNRDLVAANSSPVSAAVSVLLSLLPPTAATLTLEVSAPPGVTIDGGRYVPDPFSITGTVRNTGAVAADDVDLTVSLPGGLELASGSTSQFVGLLGPDEAAQRTWSVRATGSSHDSTLHYFLRAAASNASASPVGGQVAVPALFSVAGVTPNKGGTAGSVTVDVRGSGFKDGATVRLGGLIGQNTELVSPEEIRTTLDLTEQQPGIGQVTVVNPDGSTAAAPEPFTIVEGGQGDVVLTLVGPTLQRLPPHVNPTDVTFYLVVNNTGLVDIENLPLEISADGSGDSARIAPQALPVMRSAGPSALNFSTSLPMFFDKLAPGLRLILLRWTGPSDKECRKFEEKDLCEDERKRVSDLEIEEVITQTQLEFVTNNLTIKEGLRDAIGCDHPELLSDEMKILCGQLESEIAALRDAKLRLQDQLAAIRQELQLARQLLKDCEARNSAAPGPTSVSSATAVSTQAAANSAHAVLPTGGATLTTCAGGPRDPNDKFGPSGIGPEHYLRGDSALSYNVVFENKPDATLPAQEVVIKDQLDADKIDLSTFNLGPINFGNTRVEPPPGVSQFSTDVDLRPANNLIVRINAGLDSATGDITWRFTSLDPATGLPTMDPLAGFLPPNKEPPEGDGGVFYSVSPRVDLATGTEIRNRASIVFDTNDPMDTPEWVNTIDATPPASRVEALGTSQTQTSFPVTWSGSDDGSGIAEYSVFLSEDDGSFRPWLTATSDTSATFTGEAGHVYAFYSVATDQVGNAEPPPGVADATTNTPPPGPPQISVGDVAVKEGNTGTAMLSIPLRRTGDLTAGSTVLYTTSDGTARTDAGDYMPVTSPTIAEFPPGADTASISLAVNGDTLDEAHQTLEVRLSQPTNAVLTDRKAIGVITNDDGHGASFSVDDPTVLEGSSGSTSAAFTVTRSGPTVEASVVTAAVVAKTATTGGDYSASVTPLTLSFAPGETAKTVPFAVLGDTAVEPNETLILKLSAPVNAHMADGVGIAVIVDDDRAPPTFPPAAHFSVDDVAALEGDGGTTEMSFMVTRSGDTSGTSHVAVGTAYRTAMASSDYQTLAPTTLTFNPGDTVHLVTVRVNGDTAGEAHETFFVKLSNATNAVITDKSGTGTITNDDGANAQLSVSDVTVNEGAPGSTTPAAFVIRRNGDASEEAMVTVATADRTATAGSDYQALAPMVVTFARGVTERTVVVDVSGDAVHESNEAFRLRLSKPVRATIADKGGKATIVDNDP